MSRDDRDDREWRLFVARRMGEFAAHVTVANWLLLIIAVVLLYQGCEAHAAPAPRPAIYMNTRNAGYPVIRNDFVLDTLQVRRCSYWPTVMYNETPWGDTLSDVLTRIRRMNPGQRQFLYGTVAQTHLYMTPRTIWNEKWESARTRILRDASGAQWPWGSWLPWVVWPDWSDSTLATEAIRTQRLHQTSGVPNYFADFGTKYIRGLSSLDGKPVVGAGAAMDSARVVNMDRYLRAARGMCGILVCNGDESPGDPCDGHMFEDFTNPALTDRQFKRYLERGSRWDILKGESYGAAIGSPAWCQAWRFTLAAACMGEGMACVDRPEGPTMLPDEASVRFTLSGARYDSTGAGVGWLGEPAGLIQLPSSIWMRKFPNGVVLWNPTASPVTVDLGAPLWQRLYGAHDRRTNNGITARVVTVAARDGLFLSRRGAQ